MVNTRSNTENRTKEGTEGKQAEPTIEIDLETPDQSVDEVEKKTTESTPMPNAEEPNPKPMEFSPIETVEDTTDNTPETVKDESQAKRTSFTERLAIMVGMKSRDAAAEEPKAERGKTFGTVLTKTTDTDQSEDQVRSGAAANNRATADHETTTLELGDLMANLDQVDKKLKHSEEDREVIKKELRYNKHEYLDNYFNLARATEEKIQQMSDKVNATDEEREKNIKKDLQQMKQQYDDVNSQLGSQKTRMDAMSRNQAESSCAIQAKLDAILTNSTSQDRPAADRTQGNRVDFVEPQRNKRQSTPLPLTRDAVSTAPVGAKTIMKSGTANTTSGPGDSTTHSNVGPDAMTWASTWEMINRTLEAFATRITDSSDRGGGKSRKTFKKPKEFKDDSDGCIDTWAEVMRLHLEKDNLNDERQVEVRKLRRAKHSKSRRVSEKKHKKTEGPLFGWTATDRPLDIPPDNSDPASSTGMSINIFVRGVGVGLTHTEIFMIKKLREVRETSELERDEEEPEPTIGRNFKTKFEIPNEYSENVLITDSDFILSNRTSAICITADMSFKSRLEADFKREYQNVEFLFRQRPGLGGMAALPPSVAQVPGTYLCFLVTRVNDRNTIDPEHVMLALTRLRDFMIEKRITEVSIPVYDPNRGKLSPRELYAILHVVFAETEIMVHLHKKYYLSIA